MRPTGRRRRTVAVLILLALVAVVAVEVDMRSRPAASSPGSHGSTVARSTPHRAASPVPVRNLEVTRTQLALVDRSRPVTSDGSELAPYRSLPTSVWAPVGTGPYPLVVFVHGYDKGPLDYARFCTVLASSGYVVAAPSFPLEDPARGFPLDRSELAAEAADVSFVITAVDAAGPAYRVDPAEVAVAGHSDGADVAVLVGYGRGTLDRRVSAVVADAPDPMTGPVDPSTVPLLLVQGTRDSVVPYAASQSVFATLDAPVLYVSLIGADHLPPIAGGTPWTPVLDTAVAGFLDGTIAGRGPDSTALAAVLSRSPLVQVRTKGGAPGAGAAPSTDVGG
jgi:predicted esterase